MKEANKRLFEAIVKLHPELNMGNKKEEELYLALHEAKEATFIYDNLVEIDNAYIEDATPVGSYDATGRVSKCWITEQDFNKIKTINN